MPSFYRKFFSSRFLPLALAVAVLIVGGMAYLVINDWGSGTQEIVAAWYNSSWGYRKSIVIDPTKVSPEGLAVKTVYNTATSGTTFNVPANISTITVKAWGAGGGGGQGGSQKNGGAGGGAGFAQATLAVTPGESLTVRVGGGGAGGNNGNSNATGQGGGGGGYSGVFRSSTALIIGAGGGGGGGGDNEAGAPVGGAGGVGGGTTGGTGANGGAASTGGTGGTQSAGGTAGSGGSTAATNGASLTGGAGGQNEVNPTSNATNGGGAGGGGSNSRGGGGGGAAGYFGGGGGGGSGAATQSAAGAGGGSSYTTGEGTSTSSGSGQTAGNNTDSDYAGSAGAGGGGGASGGGSAGAAGTGGNPGLVVISYTTSGHTNFPMLFSVTDPDLRDTGSGGKTASSTAGDILFVDWEGNKIDHEIEKYTNTTGELVAWVKVPFVSSTSTRQLFIYYGNAAATYQPTNEAVWDSNYKGVWHHGEGSSSNTYDATSNSNDGALTSTTWSAGRIGNALSFNGSTSRNNAGTSSSLSMTTAVTVSGWANLSSLSQSFTRLFGHGQLTASPWGEYMLTFPDTDKIRWEVQTSNSLTFFDSTTVLSAGAWYYAVGTWDGATMRLYVNGLQENSSAKSGTVTEKHNRSGVGYAHREDDTTSGHFNGILDEVRVSNTARSSGWILTEYRNQLSPSTFYSYGGQELENRGAATPGVKIFSSTDSGPAWYNSAWTSRKEIAINPTQVSGSSGHTNFPMLFSVTDPDLRDTGSGGKTASSTAGDILFVDWEGNKIDHEIEKYTNTTGELVAWVKVPFVSSTSTRQLFIYYGNAAATYQPTNEAVWDSNYMGVWHLGDGDSTVTGFYKDSTSNTNHATLTDSDGDTNQGTGQVGSAMSFSADTGDFIKVPRYGDATTNELDPTTVTMSVWVKQAAIDSNNDTAPVCRRAANYAKCTYGFNWDEDASGNNIGNGHLLMSPTPTAYDFPYTIRDTIWHFYTINFNPDVGSGTGIYYVDGAAVSTQTSLGTTLYYRTANATDDHFWIGAADSNQGFYGTVDEVRVSSSIRSADWVQTEYNNQVFPLSFYSYGGQQAESRQDSSGAAVPAVKIRGGVKFRFDLWMREYLGERKGK